MKPPSKKAEADRAFFVLKAGTIGNMWLAISASGISMQIAEKRLGKPRGWIERQLRPDARHWSEGPFGILAEIAWAFDCRARIELIAR